MTGPLIEDLVVQESNGVNSNMADNVLPITVAATPLTGAATPLTPRTIQPIVVQLIVQDTPSASGSSCMPLISMAPAAPMAPTAVPLISISPAAPTATQLAAPTATQLAATQLAAPAATTLLPIMSVRPNQMGYFTGAHSKFLFSEQGWGQLLLKVMITITITFNNVNYNYNYNYTLLCF